MNYFDTLTSTSVMHSLRNDIASEKLAHCYVLASTDLNAISILTTLFLQYLFCLNKNACGICSECRKVSNNNHSDVKYFPHDGGTLKPIDISEMLQTIDYMSMQGSYKVFVLAGLDEASTAVQNKLLKTLEEPPKDTIMLIQSGRASQLLPTVRSRARVLQLNEVDTEKLAKDLAANWNVVQDRAIFAAQLSQGNISIAEKILQDTQYLDVFDTVVNTMSECRSSKDVLMFAEKLLKFKDTHLVLLCFGFILRDLQALEGGGKVFCLSKLSQYKSILLMYNMNAIIKCNSRNTNALKRLDQYGNTTSIIDELLLGIMEEKAKCQKL